MEEEVKAEYINIYMETAAKCSDDQFDFDNEFYRENMLRP